MLCSKETTLFKCAFFTYEKSMIENNSPLFFQRAHSTSAINRAINNLYGIAFACILTW